MTIFKKTLFLAVVFLFASCSVSKHLDNDARVHAKTKIEFKNPKIIHNTKKVESQVLSLARPKPAAGIAKWQTNLYNSLSKKVKRDSTGKAKGVRGWVFRKVGKKPVLFDARKINISTFRIQKYFNDNGYYGTTIKVDTTLKNKEVTVKYTVYPKSQYHLREINFPEDSLILVKKLFSSDQKSLLVAGEPYSQANLTKERKRLTILANDSGFLDVSQDHFYFFVDTALGSKQVDIYLRLRQTRDSSIFEPFYLNQNTVFASYSLSAKGAKNDTTQINNYKIIQQNKIIRPRVLADIIGGDKGELYSLKKQEDALTRLLDLGIYKFVNLKIDQVNLDTTFAFNRNYYLTPGLMQDVSAEFEAITRSTSYFGIAATVTYSHKNIFRGAERLDLSVSGGVGTQSNTTGNLLNSLDGAFEISMTFPRLITPFKFKGNKGAFIPKTRISVGNVYQRRVEYYTVNSFLFKYGFDWSRSKQRQHQFFPININLFVVQDITDAMRELFLENPRLEKSFSDVFILGLFYNYTLTTQTADPTSPYFYMHTGFETSGNAANLLIGSLGNQQQKPYTIFGAPYSQLVRLDGDFRHFWPLKKGVIAARFIAGVGIPYGNSDVLPYVKQYFIGGPSSIRAFAFRAIGPGSFVPPVETNYIEQTGDMRLEANLEYRFPLVSYLKGALFADAGNIWLLKENEETAPEEVFKFDRFYKEVALGTGLGLRFDLNFLVIRLDLAFPLTKPYLVEGQRWVISDINFASKAWRKDNLQWNFAIGYPF